MKKISEEMVQNITNCIANATHPNFPFIQVNALLEQLSKLENIDDREPNTQC